MKYTCNQMIDVINDFKLETIDGKDDPNLTNLELFHLVGPFRSEVACYIIKGAEDIKDLGLGVNWSDNCSA